MKKKEIVLFMTSKTKTFPAAVFNGFTILKRAAIGSFLKFLGGRKNRSKVFFSFRHLSLERDMKTDYLTNTRSKTHE